MKYLLLIVCSISICVSSAQGLSKAQKRDLEYADIDFEIGDYKRALEVYMKLVDVADEPSVMNLRIGICQYNLRHAEESIPYLERARDLGEIEAYYYLGLAYHNEERLEEEIELYQFYKNHPSEVSQPLEKIDKYIAQAKYAQSQIDRPENVDVINVGSPINTEFPEYVPLVFGEDDELYFTSRRPGSTGGKIDYRGDYFEDVYKTEQKYGFWQQPEQVTGDINTETHDACVGLSPDGYSMYFFRTSEDLVTGDLYKSEKGEDGWEDIERLPDVINSDAIETSASVSSDDRTMYFSSNREGGFGGLDIYRVIKMPDGKWSKAQNLGPTINTAENEESPFIHADNETLYFSSKGHKNMGGYDVFSSKLQSNGLWSEPTNMGYPINSVTNDLHFVMSADKLSGYYSSAAKGGMGSQDIYRINFKLEAKILSVVKGGVHSIDTAQVPVMATITLIDLRTKEVQGIYNSNPTTGKFIMVVTPESSYQVIVEADGYHTYSGELYFDALIGFGSSIEEFKLIPLQFAGE